jgi:hypothetical protein
MATIAGKNFAFKPSPDCDNGDTFERCNFSQIAANTPICAGKTGLTFRRCNLLNCSVPGDAVIEGGLTVQKSFCQHLHPEWVATGLLAGGHPENCPHVVDTDELWAGGSLIETVYHYEDTVL